MAERLCSKCAHNNCCWISQGYGVGTIHTDLDAMDCDDYHEKQEWISVEERLPEIAEHRGKYDVSVRVLCACLQKSGRRMVKEGYFEIFDGKYFDWRIPGTIDKVTHWMPLPEAPKEDVHE